MIEWTPSQKEAIESRGKNLLISAGAGSGKTAILVQRIISLIVDDGCDADRFLVVTFTKAAASQMKQKIRSALIKKLQESDDKENIASQLDKLENTQISTLHSFCRNVLRQYYYLVGIDPSCALLSDAEQAIMQNEVIEDVFEEYYTASDEAFLELADKFSPGRDDADLVGHIINIYKFARNRPNLAEWINKSCEAYDTDESNIDSSASAGYLIQISSEMIDQASQMIDSAYTLAINENAEDKITDYFYSAKTKLRKLKEALENGLCAFIAAIKETRLYDYRFRPKIDSKDKLKALRDSAKNIVDYLKSKFTFSVETYCRQLRELSPVIRKFAEVILRFDEEYRERKREKTVIDYNDLEHLCLEILSNDDAKKELKQRFDYIFVDEYQDTNEIQEMIITAVSGEDNLFCVGDLKQSIYRFRDADPQIFINRYEKYLSAPADKEKLIFLNTNFRTDPCLIRAINALFDPIFFKNTGGVNYSPNERLNAGGDSSLHAKAEVHLVQTNADSESDPALSELSAAEHEAQMLAHLIEEIVGTEIYDSGKQIKRAVRYSDIAVVGRSFAGTYGCFKKALSEKNIPFASEIAESFYDETEIALTLNVLELLNNQYNDIALVSVMRSFLFGFNADEMLKIRVHAPQKYYYHEAVSEYAENGTDEKIKEKIKKMYELLDRYTDMSKHVSIETLLSALFRENNMYAFFGALTDGERRRKSLDYLIQIAASYETASFKGLYHFLKYVNKRKEQDKEDLRRLASAGRNAVTLTTIHKSKGLEFGIVIVTNCAKAFYNPETRSAIIADKRFGICARHIDLNLMTASETLPSLAAKERVTRENISEEMRLLYVAVTRTMKKLYFTGAVRSRKELKPSALPYLYSNEIMNAGSYLNWILQSVSLTDFCGKENVLAENDYWKIVSHSPEEFAAKIQKPDSNEAEESRKNPEVSPEVKERFKEMFEFVYPYKFSSSVPSKLSVSRIKQADSELAVGEKVTSLSEPPKFARSETQLSAAQKGTIVHKILQSVDFSDFAQKDIHDSLLSQLDILIKNNIISAHEVQSVDLSVIEDFLSSDLGQIMARAETINRESSFIMQTPAGEISGEWQDSGEKIIVQGIIDCWFEYDGKLYLIDYKTDHVASPENSAKNLKQYGRQLDLYSEALERICARKPDKRCIYFLSMRKLIEM